MIKRVALAVIFAAMPLSAQDEVRPARPLRVGTVLLSLPSSHIQSPGMWEVKFTHRFNQSITEGSFSDQIHSLFGLDSSADVVFGGSYVLGERIHLSIARSNTNDTIEAAGAYQWLRQHGGSPVTLLLRGGFDWRTERDLEDRHTLFAQAIVSRRIGRNLEVFALPTFATNAGRAVDGDDSVALFEHAFNVPLGALYMLTTNLAAVAEIIPPNQDLPDDMGRRFAWSAGIKHSIGGHWFEILVTNSQATMVDQYITSTWQGSALEHDELHLGFNIERRF
jgi:hypothetical protein